MRKFKKFIKSAGLALAMFLAPVSHADAACAQLVLSSGNCFALATICANDYYVRVRLQSFNGDTLFDEFMWY